MPLVNVYLSEKEFSWLQKNKPAKMTVPKFARQCIQQVMKEGAKPDGKKE